MWHKTGMNFGLVLAVFTTWLSAQGLQGTQQGSPRRVPLTVALVESIPNRGGAFVILRRSDATPADVILLTAAADAAALSNAIHTLALARSHGGDRPRKTVMLRQRPELSNPGRSRPELPWARRVLADLRGAVPRDLAGIGRVRAVDVWLPPQTNREAHR